jgi:hypothetical protein
MMTMGNDIESLVIILGLARRVAGQMVEDVTEVRFLPDIRMCLCTGRKEVADRTKRHAIGAIRTGGRGDGRSNAAGR